MALTNKINIGNKHVYQCGNDALTLSGDTFIATTGNLYYCIHPTFTGNTQIVDKQYVDELGGSALYNLSSPSTTTVGGLIAGSVLTGKTTNCLLKDILVPYQLPSFSSFSTNISTPVEVGCQISGSKPFSWTFTNGANVQANTMCILDITAALTLSSSGSTSSPQSATITTKTFISCGQTQSWRGSAKNSCTTQFNSSNYTVTAYLPYYWGKCTCPGAAGENRPVASGVMVTGGTKVLATSSGSISINFNTTDDDYLWFAVPASVSAKTCWYITALNNGSIGGGVSPACNLFPVADLVLADSACWSNQSYNVYISNYQTSLTSSMSLT